MAAVDEVLDEAMHFWRECLANYHDPRLFRINLNALLQVARNTTFRVQSFKDRIPRFEEWYGSWQTYMKSDVRMAWLNEARIEVVKRRGLEARSSALVRVVHGYDEPMAAELDVPPGLSSHSIAVVIAKRMPMELRDHAMLEVERRWVLPTGPDTEALTTLVECLRVLVALRNSLSQLLATGDYDDVAQQPASAELPDDLEMARETRTGRLIAATGEVVTSKRIKLGYDPVLAAKAEERYGINHIPAVIPREPFAFAKALAPIAMNTLKVDGYHLPMLWMHDVSKWFLVAMVYSGRAEKWSLWHDMAERVRADNVDAIVYIGEVWVGTRADLENRVWASESPNRTEALWIYAETRDGRAHGIHIPFQHREGRIEFGVTTEEDTLAGMTAPIRVVWHEKARP